MDLQDYIEFATENPVCYLATMDGEQPRVRALQLWYADDSGFYFITLSPKAISKQMQKNPKIEACFYNNATTAADVKQMRVTGEIEFLDDEETVERAFKARPSLAEIDGKPIKPLVQPFRIAKGEAHFWTMADILKEPELDRARF